MIHKQLQHRMESTKTGKATVEYHAQQGWTSTPLNNLDKAHKHHVKLKKQAQKNTLSVFHIYEVQTPTSLSGGARNWETV